MPNHDTWFIQVIILSTQKAAVEASLLSHGVPPGNIHMRAVSPEDSDQKYTSLKFPTPIGQALTLMTAIAHAAKNEHPKSTKIFLTPDEASINLN